eukprot:TRINITY_DN1654_c0_g2_i2.p1 TRINITY_DN1654_c0_g2~~TRINITY_DN1654_c0_g2_i2.p1  ORF type:complete len:966 (-),score=231.44 TRINITY_DN1654_c0_g2_i2:1623-4520(-)
MSIYRSISAPRLSEHPAGDAQPNADDHNLQHPWAPSIIQSQQHLTASPSSGTVSLGNSPATRTQPPVATISSGVGPTTSTTSGTTIAPNNSPHHFSGESVYAYLTEGVPFISQDDPVLQYPIGKSSSSIPPTTSVPSSNAPFSGRAFGSSSSNNLAAAASASTSANGSAIPSSGSSSNLNSVWSYGGSTNAFSSSWYPPNVVNSSNSGSSGNLQASAAPRPTSNVWGQKIDSAAPMKVSNSSSGLAKSFKSVASNSVTQISDLSSANRSQSSGRLNVDSKMTSRRGSSGSSKNAGWLQSSSDEVEIFLCNPYVNEEVEHIISFLQPSAESEAYRSSIIRYVDSVVKRNLGAKIFSQGSFASKTYLPDSDMNVAAFFTHNHQRTWIQRVIKSLLREDMPKSSSNSSLTSLNKEDLSAPVENFVVRSATFIKTSHLGQIIKAQVEDLSLEISANQTHCLSAVALVEEVDRLVGRDHLFKRTIILTKAWAAYEARILGSDDGLLNSYCIVTMLMFIFNAFHGEIDTPLHGLWKLIEFTAKFEWEKYGWSLYGPVALNGTKKTAEMNMSSWPQGVEPLIPASVLSRYSNPVADESDSEVSKAKYFCLLDPRDSSNNLGANFTKHNAVLVRQAFVQSAKNFRQHISGWFASRSHKKAIFGIFKNTVLRFKLSDAPKKSPEQLQELSKLLDGNLALLVQQMMNAAEFDIPDITEDELVDLMKVVLEENSGVVTVGKMGSLMHAATNNHSLPAMLKAKYGGLKKLLRRHPSVFFIANDHPHNPRVYLRDATTGLPAAESIPSSFSSPMLFQGAPVDRGSEVKDFDGRGLQDYDGGSAANSPIGSPKVQSAAGNLNQVSASSPAIAKLSIQSVDFVETKQSQLGYEKIPIAPIPSLSIPGVLMCPLAGVMFTDPVVAADGYTYERAALEQWRVKHGNVSPITRESADLSIVYPNTSLTWLIQQFQKGLIEFKH